MEIIRYLISGAFVLMGLGIWATAIKTKSMGHILGGACYIGGAAGSFVFKSWAPLLIGFGLTFLTRRIFGDPYRTSSGTSRSNDYHQLSLMIGSSYSSGNMTSETFKDIRDAEERLFALIDSDNELGQLFEEKGADINFIKQIYETLINVGAGQWASNVWVPSEAITTPYTLNYLITALEGKDLRDKNPGEDIREIGWNILNYFKTGESLP